MKYEKIEKLTQELLDYGYHLYQIKQNISGVGGKCVWHWW